MAPTFIHAGSRGGPLRPSGSSTVPTNVRPYRVGSGTLRVVVSIGCCRKHCAMSVTAVLVMMVKIVSGSSLHSPPATLLQGALMCILGTMIAAVLPVLAYIFVSSSRKASYCYKIWK